jgi:hypothetical protein
MVISGLKNSMIPSKRNFRVRGHPSTFWVYGQNDPNNSQINILRSECFTIQAFQSSP